jgi:hypothetical protein
LGRKKLLLRSVLHFLISAQEVTQVEASKEMLRILKDRKRINLKESQRAMSLGFDIPLPPRKCLPDRHQRLVRGWDRQSAP